MPRPWERYGYVLREFRMVPKNPSRPEFHGPYNKLMCTVFPGDDYLVCPRFKPGSDPSPYFGLEILFKHKPVLTLDIKGPDDFQYSSKRQEAILQIQQRIKDLSPECPLPELHAISAFGTRLSFWKADHNQFIKPSVLVAHPEGTTADLVPQKFWDCDIVEEEAVNKRFVSLVRKIKRDCAAL